MSKNAEQKFKETNDLLQAVFDSAPNGIAVMQPAYDEKGKVEDFTILLFNAYTLNWIGNIDYKGKLYGDVFPMVKETGILEKFINVAKTGITANFESWYNGEGMKYWFRFTAVKQGELLVVTTENITERKQAEIALGEALNASEKQQRLYHSVTNNTPDLVYVFDLSYRFTYANKALLTMWGKKAEDAIGKGLRDNGYEEWHAVMHEKEIDKVVATKKSIRGTVSFPHAELGKRIYDYIFAPVFNEQGEVEAIAGSTRDITELKRAEESLLQSEARFRNMIEQAPIAILLSKGEDMVIESVNTPMLRFMNKTTADEVLGKKMLDALPELAGQPALQTVINVQRTGISFRGDEQPVELLINGKLERRYFNFSYDFIRETAESSAVLHMAVDVTEQVLTRRKIEESEAKLKTVIDQTPAPTLVLRGDDFLIEHINGPMLQMMGRGEEVNGQPLLSIMPELEGQFAWEQVKKVYYHGAGFDQEEMIVPHNRTGITQNYYYNVAYRPLREDGHITGMIQVAIDVTGQVVARQKLEESETRFRALVNATSDVVYRMNADWTIMRNLEGRGFLSDTGEPILNWMDKYIHPDDRHKVEKTVANAIATKNTFELEHQVLNTDGGLGWTFSRAIPILDNNGDILEWFGAASDITEKRKAENALKDSEQNLRNLVVQSPIGICVMDAATLVSEIVNDTFVEISGKLYNDIIGKRYWDTFAKAAPYYEAALNDVIKKGEPFYANEVQLMLVRKGREELIYVTFVYEPMKDQNNVVKKVVVWLLDNSMQVQERRKVEESERRYKVLSETLEQQVNERTRELQRSNEDLQQFAHVASHDLKEPVRKIKTFTNRLEDYLDSKLDDTATRFIERIHAATNRMFTMIDGVLAYSTINASTLIPDTVDLNETVKSIETDLEVALQKTGASINYKGLPTLKGAPVLLYQLFYNLINNSIKFAKPDIPVQINISSEIFVKNKEDIAVITLKDNGIGFEPEMAGRIFETFTRLNSKDKYEGTGLGLSLCKKIAERHGGSIIASGITGEGATFIITLPLQQKQTSI